MRAALLCALGLAVATPCLAQNPSASPHGELQVECATCHLAESWTPVRIGKGFNHAKLGFALDGAHATAACRACHASLEFTGAKTECASCHADVHRGELGSDCSRCHNARSFLDRTQMARRHQLTRFPLERMRPAIRAFWGAYARERGLPADETREALLLAVRYSAARLLQTAFEQMQSAPRVTGNIVCLLQLSWNVLERPAEAATRLLGLPA